MDGAPAIGIDLGTTYSCVAVWQHNRVEIIFNEEGKRTTPSCVAFDDAERYIGDFAKNGIAMMMNDPANTISGTKRLIGRRFSDSEVQADMKLWPFKVIEGRADTPKIVVTYKGQEKEFFPEAIYSMVLGNLKLNAEDYLGNDVKNAVVTVPVYFNESQRQATKDAATIAGINVIRMISEPAAAAIAYGLDKKCDITGNMINVLVFNLGGGTFEVSVLTICEGGRTFELKAGVSDSYLGGEDFDNRMVEYCVKEFKRRWSQDLTGNKRAMWRLRCACEQEKWFLSNRHLASINLKSLHERIDFSIKISRDTFEKLNMDFFDKCMEAVKACLNDAKMEKSCVDEVILVGGSTRIPKIRSMLKEFFENKELCMSLDPQEVIARGAAVMAAKITGNCHKRHRDMFLFTNVSETDQTTQEDQLPCKMRKLTITNKNGTRLSKEEIEKMIEDVEMYKMELKKADAIDALRAGIRYGKEDMCPKMACAIAEATKLLEHKEAASLDELLRMNHHIRSVRDEHETRP